MRRRIRFRPASHRRAALALGPAGVLALAVVAATGTPAPAGAAIPRLGPQGGGAPAIGGWSLAATAAGLRATYEQPNLPVPATPTLEADVGYSAATLDSGPVGQATASELWPGEVAASFGSQIGLVIPGAPALPSWPVQAHSAFPGGPEAVHDDQGPVSMSATSQGPTSTARSSVGTGSVAAVPAGLVAIDQLSSSSTSGAATSRATATATAEASGVAVAGGLVHLSSVATSLSGWSDGGATTYRGGTVVSGATVAGQAVTVDATGVHAMSKDVPIGLAGLTPLDVLQQAGISLRVVRVAHSTDGPSGLPVPGGSDTAEGLQLRIDLTTYDADFLALVAELPSQLSSELYQLPVPLPDEQAVTVDLGWAQVAATASPAYVPPPPTSTPPPPPSGGEQPPGLASSPPAATSAPPSAGSTGLVAAAGGYASSPATAAAAPGSTSSSTPRRPVAEATTPLPATAVPTVFRGVGAGLVGLGGLAAAGFAVVVLRADRRLFAAMRRRTCAAAGAGRPGDTGVGT